MLKKEKKPNTDSPEIIIPKADTPDIPPSPPQNPFPFKAEDYIALLNQLRVVKKSIDTVPTNTPKTFLDSIEFFDDGIDVKLYLFVNATWRYVALT